jgi:hypothetical protein
VRDAPIVEEPGEVAGALGREMPENQNLFFHRDDSSAAYSGQEP